MKESDDSFDAVLRAQPNDRWGAVLSEVIDVLSALNRRTGMTDEAALNTALKTTLALSKHFGGRPFYLPAGSRIRAALRREEIYRLHNGRNGHELADRFGLTLRAVQLMIAAQREINRTRRREVSHGPVIGMGTHVANREPSNG